MMIASTINLESPIRNFKDWENLCRDLDQQPTNDRIRNCHLVNVASLQLGEEVFDLHNAEMQNRSGRKLTTRRRSPRPLTPWIEQRYSEAFYVFHVPGDEGQPVHEGGRRQQTIFRRNRPQSTQPAPLLGDFQCDRQDALSI